MISNASLAGDMGFIKTGWSPLMTISLGPTYASPGKFQTIHLQPDIQKTYTSDFNATALFNGELFLGKQRALNDMLFGQLGVTFSASTPAKISGVVWEDANVDYNNYTYNYKIQHEHIAIKGKLLSNTDMHVSPYISASLGLGFNTAHDFTINPIIVQEVSPGSFSSNTDYAFTYTLGAGFQRSLNKNWQIGIGYEFADWGKSILGRVPEQTINHGPELDHLYTQQLQFSVTYLSGE